MGGVHRLLFLWKPGLIIWPAAAGCLFFLLRTRAHFLGDGYLLLDVLGRPGELRPLESFGYLLLEQCRPLFASAPEPSLAVYRTTAIAAGVTGVLMVRLLLPRTTWEPARQIVFLGLHLAGASTLLYCGYVEHYAFLYAFLTAFTLAGVAAGEGRVSLRMPGFLLAAAMASHLSAVLAVPALFVLAWRGVGGVGRLKRLASALAPIMAILLCLFVVLSLRAGGPSAVAASLQSDANLSRPLRPLLGEHGLLSLRVWIDIANLVLLLAPVPLVMLLSARRSDGNAIRTANEFRPTAVFANTSCSNRKCVVRLRPSRLVVAALACSPGSGCAAADRWQWRLQRSTPARGRNRRRGAVSRSTTNPTREAHRRKVSWIRPKPAIGRHIGSIRSIPR